VQPNTLEEAVQLGTQVFLGQGAVFFHFSVARDVELKVITLQELWKY
jgi:hypothetical protein